jgi:hypothetical protein
MQHTRPGAFPRSRGIVMNSHIKKAHVMAAMVGIITPIAKKEGFEFNVDANVEHYSSIVELRINAELDDRQIKRIQKAVNMIKTDVDMTIHDRMGFH